MHNNKIGDSIMQKTILMLLWLITSQYAQASAPTEDPNDWVRTFHLTPTGTNKKVAIVRDSERLYCWSSEPLLGGKYLNQTSQKKFDIPFEGGKAGYMGMTPSVSGTFSRTDSIKKFREQLQKFGTITKEAEGPLRIQMDTLESLFSLYAEKYVKLV
jgi:hypothetical protein